MSFIFRCPFCNQKLECDDDLENQTTNCPSCGEEIVPIKGNLYQQSINTTSFSTKGIQQSHDHSTILKKIGIILVCVFCAITLLIMLVINIYLKNQVASCKSEIRSLRQTISELKFGAERLKGEADAAVNDGDLDKAKKIYDDLFARHPHKKSDPVYKGAFDNIVRKIAERERIIAQRKAQQEAALLTNRTKKYDHMQSITWYETKRDCKYVTRNGSYGSRYPDEYYSVELYAGRTDNGNKLLRLRTGYYVYGDSRTWIFYKKVQIKGSNGKSVFIATEYPEKKSESGSGSIQEWSDNNVNNIEEELAEIAKSRSIFVKFYGKYPFEFKMNAEQVAAFKEIIARYNAL